MIEKTENFAKLLVLARYIVNIKIYAFFVAKIAFVIVLFQFIKDKIEYCLASTLPVIYLQLLLHCLKIVLLNSFLGNS